MENACRINDVTEIEQETASPRIYKFKIALLGEAGVGKTCIAERYSEDVFNEYSVSTTGAAYRVKKLRLCSGKVGVMLNIWDTAGQEVYRSLAPFYCKDADAVIVVYDLTRPQSLEAVSYWVQQVQQNAQKDCLITIAGNKCDCLCGEKVNENSIKALAQSANAGLFTVSAKENINIKKMFMDIVLRKLPWIRTELGYEGDAKALNAEIGSKKSPKKIRLKSLEREKLERHHGGKCAC